MGNERSPGGYLNRWERKVLRNIYGPIRPITKNCKEAITIKAARSRRLGHVHRMSGNTGSEKPLYGHIGGHRSRSQRHDVEDGRRKLGKAR